MTRTITEEEFRDDVDGVIAEVELGDSIIVTRGDVAIALITPYETEV